MHPRRDSFLAFLLPVLIVVAVVGVFLDSYRYTSHNHGKERFVAYWGGMRSWLVNGDSPYSASTTSYIETLAVHSGDPNARVTYPLYAGFFFVPFAAIPSYALARALWMTVLGIALLITALLCLRLTRWRTGTWLMALFLLLAITSYPSISLFISGNASILAAMFLVAGLDALRQEHDTSAGVMLALSTIQPLVGLVGLVWILFWAFSHHRWLAITWFFGLLAALSAVSAFFIPQWIVQWLRFILHYAVYDAPVNPRAAFQNWWPGIGHQAGLLFSAILIISLISEWWAAHSREFRWFLWTTGMTLIVAQWVGVPAGVENYCVLLVPLATIISVLEERGGAKVRWMITILLLYIYLGTWGLYFIAREGQLRPAMLFLPPLVLLFLIYYVRWWAIRPVPLLDDEKNLSQT